MSSLKKLKLKKALRQIRGRFLIFLRGMQWGSKGRAHGGGRLAGSKAPESSAHFD